LKAILESEGYSYSVVEKLDQTVRVETDTASLRQILRRSAYTRVCAQELFASGDTEDAITKAAENTNFHEILKEGETFEVRIRRIKEYSTKDDTMRLERKLGKLILQSTTGVHVNLTKPDKTFYGVLTNHRLVFGLRLAEIEPKPFVERRPRKKPFFHPSAMNAKLARCMVNLAHAKTGAVVLDPFCGTGTTILEAALTGCRAIGMDVQRRMVKGTRNNLEKFNANPEGIIVADARKPPFTRIDAVVTDPPYGKSATTLKSSTKMLVVAVLSSTKPLLREGQRICIGLPIMGNKYEDNDSNGKSENRTNQKCSMLSDLIADHARDLGYKKVESHLLYVHRSLTREIVVYEKQR
jgi:tRNA (guanine10-N2)-dimethyltransferase